MKRLLLVLLGASIALAYAESDMSELERDARALELYLQDRQDHKNFCPQFNWDQPSLDDYKRDLRSHLPGGCKK